MTRSTALPAAVLYANDARAVDVANTIPGRAELVKVGNCVLGYTKELQARGPQGAGQRFTLVEMTARGYRKALRALVQMRRGDGVVTDDDLTGWATVASDIAAAIFGPAMTLKNVEGQCAFMGIEIDPAILAPITARAAHWRRALDYQPMAGDEVGRWVRLSWRERDALLEQGVKGISRIGSFDETAKERRQRQSKERKRVDRKRAGARPRNSPKPWEVLGMKRSTYYARGLHLDGYGSFSIKEGNAPETVQKPGNAPEIVQDFGPFLAALRDPTGKAPETVQRGRK